MSSLWESPSQVVTAVRSRFLHQEGCEPGDEAGAQAGRQTGIGRGWNLKAGRKRWKVAPVRLPQKTAEQLLEPAAILRRGGLLEVHVLDRREKRRQRRLDQLDEMELAIPPVPSGGEEALPLVGDPRRGESLRGDDEDQLIGPIQPGLELPHPGAAARQVNIVEEYLPRPAGSGKAGLQVALEDLHPGLVAMGVAEERRVAVGHVPQ
ncbi:MAG TPA: hypothetical protein VFE33_28735 [Thermoanaerobaculia bacterium]|nr:hypothetical protein [Thermoanaerobaculia bacterium]